MASGEIQKFAGLEFPITVQEIKREEMKALVPCAWPADQTGAWVSIRLAGELSTRLGVLLGDLALGFRLRYHEETGVLAITFGGYNPAIWVPGLNRVVYGCESWWGVISSPDELRQITDLDIQDVWYMRALKELTEKVAGGEESDGSLHAETPDETDHGGEDEVTP